MKLHLPKALLTAVLAACMVNTTAWGGWGDNGEITGVGDVYYVEQSNIAKLDIATEKPNLTTLYIAQAVGGNNASGDKQASIEELILKAGDTLSVVTHPWRKDGSCNFSLLTINKLTIGDGTKAATFNVNAKQTVQLKTIEGVIGGEINGTLKFNTGGNTTIDYETNRMTGSGTLVIMENSSLTLTGHGGTWGSAAAVSGNINVEAGGTLYLGDGTGDSVDLLGFAQDTTSDQVDSVTLTGNENKVAQMIIRHNSANGAGRQTLSTNINLNGYSSISGGTFETFGGKFTATGTENIITCNFKGNKDYTFDVTNLSDSLLISGSFSDGTSHGNAIKDGLGTLTLSASGNVFGGKYINEEGNSIINGTSKFSQGIEINGGEFTIGANIELGKAIVLDGGSLNLGTGHTITISSLEGFHFNIESGLGNSENGFSHDDKAYDIITGFSTSNVTGTATYKLGQNNIDVIDGKYTIQGNGSTSYIVNIGDVKTSSSAVSGATKFFVYAHEEQTAGNLIIDSDVGDIKAVDILLGTEGNGNITVKKNISISAGSSSKAKGTLTIQNSTINILAANGGAIGNDHHNTKNSTTRLDTFTKVILDNAVIEYIGKTTTLNNVTVETTGATLKFNDMGNSSGEYFTLAGVTNLKGLLTIDKFNAAGGAWKYGVKIKELSGTGNISFKSASQAGLLSIESFSDYSGSISYDGNNTAYAGNLLTLGESWAGKLSVSNIADTSDYQRNLDFIGKISTGGTLTLSNVNGWISNQAIAANVVLSGAGLKLSNGSSLTSNIGTNANYTFNGTVSGNGNYEINLDGGPNNLTTAFVSDISQWKAAAGSSNHMLFSTFEPDGTTPEAKTFYLFVKDNATVVNVSDIKTAGTATLNMKTSHSKDATINSNIANGGTAINLEVSNTKATTTFNGSITVNEIDITSGSNATFSNKSITTNKVEVANLAIVSFTNLAKLQLQDLVVKSGATLSVGNGVATANASTSAAATSVSKSASLQGGATINGGLDLSAATSLTLDGVGSNAVKIGGDLVLPESRTPLTLRGDVLNSIASLRAGEQLEIFDVKGGFFVGGTQYSEALTASNGIILDTIFSSEDINLENYYLGFYNIPDEAGYSTVYIGMIVPEPTTATLSLLALAALAARRRRK